MPQFVVGHKIPDTDSIIGAITLSHLLNAIGQEAVPVRQGVVAPETQFILDRFGFEAPEFKDSFAGDEAWLIDYSDLAQAPDDILKGTIKGIVDHHKLGDVITSTPLECWIRPVGCSNTIVKEMFDHHGVTPPANIAGAMVCAILSDTVMFKSPTCTDVDKKAVAELAEIAGIDDVMELGMEMFKVKSAVDGTPMRELVQRDFKDFDMGGNLVGIGQLEVVDLAVFDKIKAGLEEDIRALKAEGGRHSVLLLLTDIMKEGSEILVASDDPAIVEKAYGCQLEADKAWLPGVLSRKKQVVPPLQDAFTK